MIILDTNVISELMSARPDSRVIAWFDWQPPQPLATTAITIAELHYGIALLNDRRRCDTLRDQVNEMIAEDLQGQVLTFDERAAEAYGVLAAQHRRKGIVVGQSDAMITAIVSVYDAALATRNVRHFLNAGIVVLNPFDG